MTFGRFNEATGVSLAPFCALAVLVVLALAVFAHTYGFRLDLIYAVRGFSILEVVEAHANPQAFARDFPGGSRITSAASPMVYVYFALHDFLGVSALLANYFIICIEILFLTAGSYMLWSTLARDRGDAPDSDPLYGWLFVCVLTILLVSDFQKPNLAAFGFPFFHGQFYGFADGLRLAGIALVLRRKWITSAIVLSFCFFIHPIKATFAMAFLVPLLLIDWREILNPRCLLSIAGTLAASSLWYIWTLAHEESGVSLRDFIDFTRLLQWHWYPMDTGATGSLHETYLSPFLAMTLMSFAALGHTGWSRKLQLKMGVGLIVLLTITALGIWISYEARSATLIRISLVRASTLVTLLAPFILMSAVFATWRRQRWILTTALLVFQASAFFGQDNMAILFAILFVFLAQPGSDSGKTVRWLITGLTAAVAVASLWLWQAYPRSDDPVKAALPAIVVAVIFWGAFFRLPVWLTRWSVFRGLPTGIPTVFAAVFLMFGVIWTSERIQRIPGGEDWAQAYLATQLWARKNTVPGSLFMVDPCRAYGWRDYSARASIGTVREWYMTGWVYSDDSRVLEKGDKISKLLGFDIDPFRGRVNSPETRRDICKTARAAYYRSDMRGQKAVAVEFGVDYFVFELDHAENSLTKYVSEFAFQNAHFAILPAEKLR